MAIADKLPGHVDLYRAAEIIGVSHAQVTRYIQDGKLNAIRLGRDYLVKESDAKKFVRPKRGNPTFLRDKSRSSRAD